jgi:hypothetical protein
MRQVQKGDQKPRQGDHRRIRVASVLILRTLRKTNYRVPEETQASSVQNDLIATQSRFLSQHKDRNSTRRFFVSPCSERGVGDSVTGSWRFKKQPLQVSHQQN